MAGILTRCAACLVDIPHTAPRCGRCHTRYCGEACQREHWKQEPTHPWSTGPHEKFCKTIKKAGGAEQHYANQKYAQAVKTAEDCCDTSTKDNGPKAAKNKNLKYVVGETPVDDTSAAIRTQLKIDGHTGLTCHVCRKGGKLVRMCACSGKNGFAHIACLEKKAAKSVEDAVNKRGPRVPHSEQSWARWNACPLCGAEYVGQLSNALGWACWRTYCRRTDEADWQLRFNATGFLARGLYGAEHEGGESGVSRARLGMYRNRVLGNVSQRGYELETVSEADFHTSTYCPCGVTVVPVPASARFFGGSTSNSLVFPRQRGCTMAWNAPQRGMILRIASSLVDFHNIACCCNQLKLSDQQCCEDVLELSKSMIKMSQFTMSVLFLKEVLRLAERTDIGCATTLQLNWIYAVAIFNDARTPEEMEHAIPYFKKAAERARRTQGEDHALTLKFEQTLADARGVIDGKGIARLSNINARCYNIRFTGGTCSDASPTFPMWPRTRRRSSGSGHAQSIAGVRSVAGSEMRHRCRQRRAPGRSRSFLHSRFVREFP